MLLLLFSFPSAAGAGDKKEPLGKITTTNYCEGHVTSSQEKIKPGDVALSHDLVRRHKLKFGDLVYVEGEDKPYTFTDYMPGRHRQHADFYMRPCKDAKKYGVQKRTLWFIRK